MSRFQSIQEGHPVLRWKADVRMRKLGRACLLPLALTTVICSGCSPNSTPPGPNAAGGTYHNSSFAFLRWKEGPAIMVWHDALVALAGSGTGSTSDPVYPCHGSIEAIDGRRLDYRLETAEEKCAQFWCGDETYDLSEGALFIIETEDSFDVTQLRRGLSGVPMASGWPLSPAI